MVEFTHTFVSTVPDVADPAWVRPSNWNAIHTVTYTTITVTSSGTTVIQSSVDFVIFNKAVASSSPCTLPTVTGRNNVELRIYDWAGTAGDIGLNSFSTAQLIMGSTFEWIIGSGGSVGTGGAITLVSVASSTGGVNGWLVK